MTFKKSSAQWRPFCSGLDVTADIVYVLSIVDSPGLARLWPLHCYGMICNLDTSNGRSNIIRCDRSPICLLGRRPSRDWTIGFTYWTLSPLPPGINELMLTPLPCPCTPHSMMTSSNGNFFRVTGHLCGEFTGLRGIHRTKASVAELWCFLWYAPK